MKKPIVACLVKNEKKRGWIKTNNPPPYFSHLCIAFTKKFTHLHFAATPQIFSASTVTLPLKLGPAKFNFQATNT